jgi:seryl-tRNA synthetase
MVTAKNIQTILEEIIKRVNEHSRRLRLIEERNRALEMRIGTAEETILRNNENMRDEIAKINVRLREIEERLMRIENDIQKILKDLAKTARKTELRELEHLINLFNPLKSTFITREEVERLIKEKIKT